MAWLHKDGIGSVKFVRAALLLVSPHGNLFPLSQAAAEAVPGTTPPADGRVRRVRGALNETWRRAVDSEVTSSVLGGLLPVPL
jgi:succinylarginine dihydrolase